MARMWLDPEGNERKAIPIGLILLGVGIAGLAVGFLTPLPFLGGSLFGFALTSWLWLRLMVNLVGTYQEVFLALKWDKIAQEAEEEAQNGGR